MKIHDFQKKKNNQNKITMITAYDYTAASIIENSDADCVLVGDSLAMVIHGFPDTTNATVDMMVLHTKAVSRGLKTKFLVGDLPFLSYRKSLTQTMNAVEALMQAGAQSVKLEGAAGNIDTIKHIVASGVPVMGHLGLTPQHVHQLGGFKVQGKKADAQTQLLEDAKALEAAGCFAIVLECIPNALAKHISETLTIPTIGIGAGPHTDGQVLVWHDLLGMQNNISPKFLKRYLSGFDLIQGAINQYAAEVQAQTYPDMELHCY